MTDRLQNFINGTWETSSAESLLAVINPASTEVVAHVPLSSAEEVHKAAANAALAYKTWRKTPVFERVQQLFRLKSLIEANLKDLATTITDECGKTLAESTGEMQRAIENVETACGMPMLIQG